MEAKPELLSPAGDYGKLVAAYEYGADAAYMGLGKYSLRKNAGNINSLEDLERIRELKNRLHKRLYCAMNILFSEDEIADAEKLIPTLKDAPFDAYIISDIGLVPIFQKYLPDVELHLSTQASAINSSSVSMYRKMGFKRIILGREATLDDIKRIKDRNPDVELEAFVHGAMCMSYSGRCLLSAYLAGRSANKGECAHTCRWKYRVLLEEEERPGQYYPIEEAGDKAFTTILSSKDLCMIDHIKELEDAGLSSFKIEGRMKSAYYVALTTRAYRKAIDDDADKDKYRDDLFNVSHREFSTGFFFGKDSYDKESINAHTSYGYNREYLFLGTVLEKVATNTYKIDVRNQLKSGKTIEYIGPDTYCIKDDSFSLIDTDGNSVEKLDHSGKEGYLITDKAIKPGYILRSEADIKVLD